MEVLAAPARAVMPLGRAGQGGCGLQRGEQLVLGVHPAVEVAQQHEGRTFLPALGEPALDWRHLAAQGGALRAAAGVKPVAAAAGLQVDREDAQRTGGQVQRDIHAAAEAVEGGRV